MSKQLFITSTGTDVGKTYILEKICQKLGSGNFQAIKPVISGFEPDDANSDSARILKLLGKTLSEENLNEISPWRFKAPLSPNIAATLENKKINFNELANFCLEKILQAKKNDQYLLIEGAGGVMTPVTDSKTYADLISCLNIPVILVIGDYLGTISHTLTALKALEFYKIPVEKIIFNPRDSMNSQATLKTLKNFINPNIIQEI